MTTPTQQRRQLAIETPLGKDQLLLTALAGREEMSRLFRFDLEMLSTDQGIRPESLVGMNVTFHVVREDGSPRHFNGFVKTFAAGPMTRMTRFRKYRAEVVPWLWFLTQTADCRIFQQMTAPDIIAKVFQDLGFSDFDTSGLKNSYPKREYCVQYRETDFNFVSRLMEEEGVFYYFRHQNGKHVLVLADAPTGYRPGPDPVLRYQGTESTHSGGERITQWEHRYEFRSGRWAHTDYNFEVPGRSLMANENSVVKLPNNKAFEVYDYPGIYDETGEGRRLVRVRMEEVETGHDEVAGESLCRALAPGETFSLAEYEVTSENGRDFVLTSVDHEAYEPADYETVAGGNGDPQRDDPHYRNRFTCIPASVPFRPARLTRKPVVEGPQTAAIVGPPGEEIYPDEYGRVKVQFHWDREGKRDENSSCWIRVSQIHAGQGWGYMDIPRIGEEVIVDFLEGDPDRPIITGRVYNGDNMPPFALPAGKTRRGNTTKTYKDAGYNEMSMDDTPGAEQIRIHAQYNMDSVVQNDETHTVHNNRTKAVDVDEAMTIGNNQTLDVGVNKNVHVGTSHTESVGVSQSVSVGTSQSNTVGVVKQEKVGSLSNQLVGALKNAAIGFVMNEMIGLVKSFIVGSTFSVKAGRSVTITAGTSIEITCGASSITMDSGGKIVIAGSDITINSSGPTTCNSGGVTQINGGGNVEIKGPLIDLN